MRLFIAINIPAAHRTRLYAQTESLRSADMPVRWVKEESLHLTLKFLGWVEDERADAIIQTVRDTAAPFASFPLRLAGAGAFPNARRPRVWWIGVEPTDELRNVQDQMEGALARHGFERERRPFSPHITIGRTRGGPTRLPQAEPLLRGIDYSVDFEVATVDVMRSHLSPAGARYEVVARAHMGSAEAA